MQKEQAAKENHISSWMMFMLAAACGLIVANLYYAQTLVGPISVSTGLSSTAAGLIVTLTQIGYVVGLLFIVPLSDIVENRRLTIITLMVAVGALLVAAFAANAPLFLTASLFIGTGSVVAQILVPYATYLASEEQRGRVVGNVMSGLLLGIMFARPVASFITSIWGWQAVFIFSAVVITLLAILLSRFLPERKPAPSVSYSKLIVSLGTLLKQTPILRRRALYQAYLFGAFSLFWTVVPLRLADDFGMSQQGIAWFALVGVGGAVAAPIAGRLADKGWSKWLTGLAMIIATLSFLLIHLFHSHSTFALILLFISAITLDMAVSGNLVLGQRVIYSLGSEARGRLNGIFMAIFFVGGAVGSSLGGWAYAYGGWTFASLIGVILPLLALVYFFTEKRSTKAVE
ncbi:MFS transporter [Paenibacillus odorifer]|uniref:MFS transporter n=1 Tax=Paenibacillus TaxID=44249 RepID=UPI00096F3026|nr:MULTISPECIES: MFS transporter [Paenibacillus]MDH6426307.1 putative MFS family arabinose efflux permease [Paenibacillus sp. PastH-4]MDH6442330.1 putative MFS family arabinose efflux permease [Paenibacillus sp. PastF-4]MDH6526957.1 putative MFS family arabinose efflux permease [Paenibacillus sp. PastH-3]OMD69564.1 MFS transporter [Paenibacillus odorifer]